LSEGLPPGESAARTVAAVIARSPVNGARNPVTGTGLAVASAATFAGSGPLAKSMMDTGFTPIQLSLLRIGLAAVLVLVPVAALRPRALRLRRRDWGVVLGYGLFGVAGAQAFFFVAVTRIPVGVAVLLEFTAPVFVALWVRFMRRRRLPTAVWLGIALAMAGLAMVAQVWHGFALNPVGVAAGLGSALSTTGYFLIGEYGANTRDPFGLLAGGLVIGAIAVGFAAPPWLLPTARFGATATLGGAALPVWLVVALLAVISTAVPYLCGLTSLRHLPSSTASVLGLLEPITATVLAWWLIGQSLQPLQLLGGVVVLGGAILVQIATHAT
jgi:drug/metabolite transporter (DMT)-like permease